MICNCKNFPMTADIEYPAHPYFCCFFYYSTSRVISQFELKKINEEILGIKKSRWWLLSLAYLFYFSGRPLKRRKEAETCIDTTKKVSTWPIFINFKNITPQYMPLYILYRYLPIESKLPFYQNWIRCFLFPWMYIFYL